MTGLGYSGGGGFVRIGFIEWVQRRFLHVGRNDGTGLFRVCCGGRKVLWGRLRDPHATLRMTTRGKRVIRVFFVRIKILNAPSFRPNEVRGEISCYH